MREIRDELINAQISIINQKSQTVYSKKTQFKSLSETYAEKWKLLFDLEVLGDLDKPLTTKILSNPNHNITNHILYLYSMESFIYGELNRASRDKD